MRESRIIFVQDWLLSIMTKNNYEPHKLFLLGLSPESFLSKEAFIDLQSVNELLCLSLGISEGLPEKSIFNPVDKGTSEKRVISFLDSEDGEAAPYEINMLNKTDIFISVKEGFSKKVLESREETAKFFLACFVKAHSLLNIKELANSQLLEKVLKYRSQLSFI